MRIREEVEQRSLSMGPYVGWVVNGWRPIDPDGVSDAVAEEVPSRSHCLDVPGCCSEKELGESENE